MMGSAKAHYDSIKAFFETNQTADLKAIGVPALVLHGDQNRQQRSALDQTAQGLRIVNP